MAREMMATPSMSTPAAAPVLTGVPPVSTSRSESTHKQGGAAVAGNSTVGSPGVGVPIRVRVETQTQRFRGLFCWVGVEVGVGLGLGLGLEYHGHVSLEEIR